MSAKSSSSYLHSRIEKQLPACTIRAEVALFGFELASRIRRTAIFGDRIRDIHPRDYKLSRWLHEYSSRRMRDLGHMMLETVVARRIGVLENICYCIVSSGTRFGYKGSLGRDPARHGCARRATRELVTRRRARQRKFRMILTRQLVE